MRRPSRPHTGPTPARESGEPGGLVEGTRQPPGRTPSPPGAPVCACARDSGLHGWYACVTIESLEKAGSGPLFKKLARMAGKAGKRECRQNESKHYGETRRRRRRESERYKKIKDMAAPQALLAQVSGGLEAWGVPALIRNPVEQPGTHGNAGRAGVTQNAWNIVGSMGNDVQ
eukprot:gene10290-biopygen1754